MRIHLGNNLEVLRGLPADSFDMAYADPPFCTGRDFGAFDDRWDAPDMKVLDGLPGPVASLVALAEEAHSSAMAGYITFMAARIVEMKRVLVREGSLWLHCDDSAVGWLRPLMDIVIGKSRFSAQVVWKRTYAHGSATRNLGRVVDYILLYRGPGATWNAPRVPLDSKYVASNYRYDDGDGRGTYRRDNLTAVGELDGRVYEYKGRLPAKGRRWTLDKKRMEELDEDNRLYFAPNGKTIDIKRHLNKGPYALHPMCAPGESKARTYEYAGLTPKKGRRWRCSPEEMKRLDEAGLLYIPPNSTTIRRKKYLSDMNGKLVGNLWDDIARITSGAKEGTGYPTQKPLALLDRIISASTNEGDRVLDPFMGSGTTLASAAALGRDATGIDCNPEAANAALNRLRAAGHSVELVR